MHHHVGQVADAEPDTQGKVEELPVDKVGSSIGVMRRQDVAGIGIAMDRGQILPRGRALNHPLRVEREDLVQKCPIVVRDAGAEVINHRLKTGVHAWRVPGLLAS